MGKELGSKVLRAKNVGLQGKLGTTLEPVLQEMEQLCDNPSHVASRTCVNSKHSESVSRSDEMGQNQILFAQDVDIRIATIINQY